MIFTVFLRLTVNLQKTKKPKNQNLTVIGF